MIPFKSCQLATTESNCIITKGCPLLFTHNYTVCLRDFATTYGLHLSVLIVDCLLGIRDCYLLEISEDVLDVLLTSIS